MYNTSIVQTNEESLRLSWILQNFLARPHRYIQLLISLFLHLQLYSMYLQNILNHFSCKRRRISYLSLSPFRCLSLFILNLYWMKWSLITFSIFFSLRTKSIKSKTKHTNTHTHELNKIPKKKLQNTQKQICPKIYIKYVCMKTQILEEVLQSLLFLFEKLFFSHSLCLCLEVLLFLLVWYWFILACKISPTCFVNENSVLTKL